MPNRLANETSPYLLQHADNPVDWYGWGAEALAAGLPVGGFSPGAGGLARAFARRAAIRATVGLVLKALGREKLLLSGAEDEWRTAIGAGQRFIGVHAH